ncbi:MAG: hypothetical protein FJX56_06230 [Alphaproteobacteria bacterium]|nr:hypothetical protein [Alphaproteobacteria bacterium]
MTQKRVRCFAEGSSGRWEAICIDLDIAVQGRTFDEVYRSLDEAVRHFLMDLERRPPTDRARLLARRAPWTARLRFLFRVLGASLRQPRPDQTVVECGQFITSCTA